MTLRSVFAATLLLVAGYAHAEKGSEPPACVSVGQVGPASCVPAGSIINIEVTLTTDCSDPIQALGFREELPPGWIFEGVQGDDPPVEAPAPDSMGTLDFIWIDVPDFPVVFTFEVTVPLDSVGPQTLTGYAEYRLSGGALFSAVSEVVLCVDDASEGEGEGEGCALQQGKHLQLLRESLGDFLIGVASLLVLAGFRSLAERGGL